MKAVMFVPSPAGGIVEVREVSKPGIQAGQVLVRVRAAAINRGELGILPGLKTGAPRPTGIEFAGEMFMAARELILASLPKNLSEREIKTHYYRQMYGEPLPEDFFKDEE